MQLSAERQIALSGIYDSTGLQAVLDVAEQIVIESENNLIGETPANKDAVTALHAIAHAQRAMLNAMAEKIDYYTAEQRGGDKKSLLDSRK